jgi:DNA-binding LacI/PurR family transcriptional regulator
VVLDDQAGAALSIQHLIDLGHREIAYLAGPPAVETAEQRRAGVVKCCQEAGIALPESRVASCGYGGEGVDAAVERLLTNDRKVTAIAAASIVIAFAAAKAIQARGLRIPDDISLIGYHDTPLAAFVTPGITTVEMPLVELGRHAMLNILARANGVATPSEVISNPGPRVILRQSTAPPARS